MSDRFILMPPQRTLKEKKGYTDEWIHKHTEWQRHFLSSSSQLKTNKQSVISFLIFLNCTKPKTKKLFKTMKLWTSNCRRCPHVPCRRSCPVTRQPPWTQKLTIKRLGEPSKKKKLPNFGHRPNMAEGGVSGAAKPFIEKRYGHVLRGRGGKGPRPKWFSTKKYVF